MRRGSGKRLYAEKHTHTHTHTSTYAHVSRVLDPLRSRHRTGKTEGEGTKRRIRRNCTPTLRQGVNSFLASSDSLWAYYGCSLTAVAVTVVSTAADAAVLTLRTRQGAQKKREPPPPQQQQQR